MKILCCIYADMYYDRAMRSLEYNTFWPACKKLGEAHLFQLDIQGIDKKTHRQMLESAIACFKPDIIFAVPVHDEIPDLTSLGTPAVAWICDSYRSDWIPGEIGKYTHVVGTDRKTGDMALSLGKPFLLSGWACNPDFHVPSPKKDLDIVWIGQNSAWRRGYIDALRKHFGSRAIIRGWNFPEGPVTWKEYVDLLGRAKISLSFSKDMSGAPQAKLRPFEVTACGALLLAEEPNCLGDYLHEGTEYVGFTDEQSMIAECEHFLLRNQERKAIAHRGRRRTVREHTFENRLRGVFEWALSTQA